MERCRVNLDEIFMSVQNIDSFINPNIFAKNTNQILVKMQSCGYKKDGILKGIVTNPDLFPNVCESLNKCD